MTSAGALSWSWSGSCGCLDWVGERSDDRGGLRRGDEVADLAGDLGAAALPGVAGGHALEDGELVEGDADGAVLLMLPPGPVPVTGPGDALVGLDGEMAQVALLTKPYSRDDLARAVRQALEGS